jgi:PAS domain S-box-containing protein
LGSESFTNFLEFIPKESHSMVRRALHKSLVRKKNTHFELEIETKTGPRWWSIRVLPLIDNGNVRSFLLVSTDITFRRDAEEALKKSEERYRFLAENMLDSVFMMDLNWNHIYVSPSIEKIRGYTPDEIMTLPIEESLPSHSLERAFQLRDHEANRLKNDPKAVPIVYTFEQEENCKDGSTVWTEVRAWCVIDENREPAYIMGITHDITERREAEARLRQSEENYRTLMENLPLPAIVHRDARLVFVNSRAVMELGVHDPDEVLGRSLYDFLHPDYHDMVRERIQEMQQAPAAHISRLNLKIIKIDGSVIEVRTSASRILYEGEPAHLVLVEEVLGS